MTLDCFPFWRLLPALTSNDLGIQLLQLLKLPDPFRQESHEADERLMAHWHQAHPDFQKSCSEMIAVSSRRMDSPSIVGKSEN